MSKKRHASLNLARRANQAQQKRQQTTRRLLQPGQSQQPAREALPSLKKYLQRARQALTEQAPDQPCLLVVSFSDGRKRANIVHHNGQPPAQALDKLESQIKKRLKRDPMKVRWLKVDWAVDWQSSTWGQLKQDLSQHQANFFRCHLALDSAAEFIFLEQELNAHSIWHSNAREKKCHWDEATFARYAKHSYGQQLEINTADDQIVYTFSSEGLLIDEHGHTHRLHSTGMQQGIRQTPLDENLCRTLIRQASLHLAAQVTPSGRFVYGINPCFHRILNQYNSLRHMGTLYSMLEAWEVTAHESVKQAIDSALQYALTELVKDYTLDSGQTLAYVVDGEEIRLGGSGICLLALVKYTQLTQDTQHLPLMERLAAGIEHMQNPQTGQFYHILNRSDLSLKEAFRVIYYDGEVAFALLRLYGLTGNERWLAVVKKGFDYFIAQDHWKIHDHWQGYAINELTLYCPEERYFKFGIQNIAGRIHVLRNRQTSNPILLELAVASYQLLERLKTYPQHQHLFALIDLEAFYDALDHRAQRLVNFFFWPELALYYPKAERILGSFFMRESDFRIRIDDVQHTLSGFIVYMHYRLHQNQSVSNAC